MTTTTIEQIVAALRDLEPSPQTPTIAHIGISVPDIELAIDWYTRVLGFRLLSGPVEAAAGGEGWGEIVADIHGPTIGRLKLAQLTGANGSGVELLEYVEPRFAPADGWAYNRAGTTHINLVTADVEGMLARIERAGGRRRTSRIWPIFPDTPFRFAFAEDPWGTVIELYSHSPEWIYGGAPQRP